MLEWFAKPFIIHLFLGIQLKKAAPFIRLDIAGRVEAWAWYLLF